MKLLLACLILVASPVIATAADKMSGKELTALLSQGKHLTLGGKGEGYTGALDLTANGKGKGQATLDDGTVIPIEGAWHIKGNKFCRTWKGGRDAGKEVCETWVKSGAKAVKVMVGKEDMGVNSWN